MQSPHDVSIVVQSGTPVNMTISCSIKIHVIKMYNMLLVRLFDRFLSKSNFMVVSDVIFGS